ncbi:MAG TPA: PhzF family phenazine biosynthesis protein [Cyclobacteriaceae bacterium]|nr:PhzF family phenazine biosynthesis protein [Cyclobacteriaceae bacterium]
MQIKLYQVDAFTDKLFGGNPAAVCPLTSWLPDALLQSIALENNLAETAFYVHEKDGLRIRWFTPGAEVDLCGHATLATAFVLFKEGYDKDIITFNSRSGPLKVTRNGELLTLNFPTDIINEVSVTPELSAGFNIAPVKALKGKTDYLLVFENEGQVRNLKPDFKEVAKIKARGVIVTAKGDKVDFVSRFFGPQVAIDEDPVTGSAHTTLIPYWARVLKKNKLNAVQCSPRGGKLFCELKGDRVDIAGNGKLFMEGTIYLD